MVPHASTCFLSSIIFVIVRDAETDPKLVAVATYR
jgi:hypothetical protein